MRKDDETGTLLEQLEYYAEWYRLAMPDSEISKTLNAAMKQIQESLENRIIRLLSNDKWHTITFVAKNDGGLVINSITVAERPAAFQNSYKGY